MVEKIKENDVCMIWRVLIYYHDHCNRVLCHAINFDLKKYLYAKDYKKMSKIEKIAFVFALIDSYLKRKEKKVTDIYLRDCTELYRAFCQT